MEINKIIVKNLNGFINKEIDFDPKLNFLIGINGSGKTSILKLLIGLLKPSFRFINELSFDQVNLLCSSSSSKKDIKISCYRIDDEQFEISFAQRNKQSLIKGKFQHLNKIINDYSLPVELRRERFAQAGEAFHKLKPVVKISELISPSFLGLDRRSNNTILISQSRRWAYKKPSEFSLSNDQLKDSLQEVQAMVFDYFRLKAQKQPEIAEDFKTKLFSRSFEFLNTTSKSISITTPNLAERKDEIIEATKTLGLEVLKHQIEDFFSKIISLQASIQKKQERNKEVSFEKKDLQLYEKWFLNSPQLVRIEEVIKLSSDYQDQIKRLNEPIKKFESLVNKFFIEGKKELQVEGNGEIKIKLPNGNCSNIYNISSGEKQIIIMIASLIFTNNATEKIFIIDEPEVSLHLAWQEIFVEAILSASPDTQFILATHSPTIIGSLENEKYCKDLSI